MANLDKLLKEIEKKQEQERNLDELTEKINVRDEEYSVRVLNRQNKKELSCVLFDYKVQNQSSSVLVEKVKPIIYRALSEMPKLAVKAKNAKLIEKNYDIIDNVFTVFEIFEIMSKICAMNGITDDNLDEKIEEEMEELKKQ